jgi:hypothetical protein
MYARWSTLGIRTSEKPHNANFHEKALFVKADLAAPCRALELRVLRAMLPSALLVSLLFGDSVHYEIHLFGLLSLKALQSSERSLLLLAEGGPSSHGAVALSRSEAIGYTEAERVSL